MNQLLLLLTGLLFLNPVRSQNLVGLTKEQVEKEVKVSYPTFAKDNSFVNNTYKYLKYTDNIHEQTLLVFLSEKDECTSTKLICDYSMLDQVKKDMKKYKPDGTDCWSFTENGIEFIIKLQRDEWFFSVLTRKKN